MARCGRVRAVAMRAPAGGRPQHLSVVHFDTSYVGRARAVGELNIICLLPKPRLPLAFAARQGGVLRAAGAVLAYDCFVHRRHESSAPPAPPLRESAATPTNASNLLRRTSACVQRTAAKDALRSCCTQAGRRATASLDSDGDGSASR